MKKALFLPLIIFLNFSNASFADEKINFPTKPIKIIVYTSPGGLIDVTARKLANVLEKKVVNVPVVVQNKKGAGGLVALNYLNRAPKDGHTLFALTNSVISKAIFSGKENLLNNLYYLNQIALDYECFIARENLSFEDFIKNSDKLIYTGPSIGGTDHSFFKAVLNSKNKKARYIPYKSGSEALSALLGKHADIYVGNPQDIYGRDGLKILAIASSKRLKNYNNTPTFLEKGLEINDNFLWRGLSTHVDVKPKIREKLIELINKAVKQSEFKQFVKDSGVLLSDKTGNDFKLAVSKEINELKKLKS